MAHQGRRVGGKKEIVVRDQRYVIEGGRIKPHLGDGPGEMGGQVKTGGRFLDHDAGGMTGLTGFLFPLDDQNAPPGLGEP